MPSRLTNTKSKLKRDLVFFDVETTGLSPRYGDRIVEIAAIRVKDLKIINRFETLINPQRNISEGAYRVNKISAGMIENAPVIAEVMDDLTTFLDNAHLIGHNVNFDLSFLNNELDLCGYPLLKRRNASDTISLAKRIVPGLASYSLQNLAHHLGITNTQSHRAMADVEMTFDVFCRLEEKAKEQNIAIL